MTLDDLAALIAARKNADPASSWTAQLLAKGPQNAPRNSVKRRSRRSSKPSKATATNSHPKPPTCFTIFW